ncbi:hypothetical protein QJS83_16975 [Bdellovibrio sp. 22V]|uniref:hypothetical protein n=1 Tax=Bdellovibrio sp. 22V TaxID=3044166 RepID=UPI00254322B2|nr:hypothetical protein [Bdellovibrio sp. 22V]WII72158.1 hypothetical protein QJS83_16975 [Bdellovibrio sp. 22V]
MASFVLSVVLISGCSSPPKRSVWSDKNMRVFIDPDSVSSQDYVEISNELVKSGRFMVIDRAQGFRAVQREQERLHRVQADRFENKEKYAIWGKMFGVGAIVVGHSQCYRRKPWISFSSAPYLNSCSQYLSLIDSNTGEVILSVDGKDEQPAPGNNWGSESFTPPQNWANIVDKFVNSYPENYKPAYYSESMMKYRDQAEQEALKQKEFLLQKNQNRTPANNLQESQQRDLMFMNEAVQQQNANGL